MNILLKPIITEKLTEQEEKMNRYGILITIEELKFVVEHNDKKRFSFSESGEKIRANQGHSVKIDLGYESIKPPDFLYHGTVEKFILNIDRLSLLNYIPSYDFKVFFRNVLVNFNFFSNFIS